MIVERGDYERERIQAELERCGGNVKATAEKLGLSRQRVYRLLGKPGEATSTNGAGGGEVARDRD
jgi:DNA-binding NtrC family response regulator